MILPPLPLEFIPWGCRNKGPKGCGLEQQQFLISSFWRLEAQNRGVGRTVLPLKVLERDLLLASQLLVSSWLVEA